MPHMPNRRGEILHWDDVYAQYSDAAAATPIGKIDRDLAAMGYDLDKVRAAAGALDRRATTGTGAGLTAPVAAYADRHLPPVPPPVRGWKTRTMLAGMVAAALLGMLVLPVSDALVGGRPAAFIVRTEGKPGMADARIADASPGTKHAGGVAGAYGSGSSVSVAATEDRNHIKIAMLKKCGADVENARCAADERAWPADREALSQLKHRMERHVPDDGTLASSHIPQSLLFSRPT